MRTLRGRLRGADSSAVAATITDDGLVARILLPTGRELWIEPLAGRVPGANRSHHAVYDADDVTDPGGACAAHEAAETGDAVDPGETEPTAMAAGSLYLSDIACDADYEYFQRWGSATAVADRIEAVLNAVSLQYERDVGIRFVLGSVIVRSSPSSDPYTSTDPNALLNEFTSHWRSAHTSVPRDVAHLFTGKDLDGSVIGIAWLSVICSSYGFGVSQSDFSSNFASVTDLTAHELGHNWSAGHCSCSGYTMNSYLTSANRFHATESIPEIIAFRDGLGCLDLSEPGSVPAAPSSLAATLSSDTSAELSWSDASTDELGFEIDRSTSSSAWTLLATVGAGVTAWSDAGLTAGETYSYRVRAYNDSGASANSNVASVTAPLPVTPPAAATNLAATTVSSDAIDLAWNDASTTEDGFRVERSDGGSWSVVATLAANATSHSDNGLAASTLYSYRIVAFNAAGDSAPSNIANATTDAPPAFVVAYAQSEVTAAGTAAGGLNATRVVDGQIETITERESGGPKRSRTSYAEHYWTFAIQGGAAVTVLAEASTSDESFEFAYSLDGSPYASLFEVSGAQSAYAAALPPTSSGTLSIRVVDADRTPGNIGLDRVSVDRLVVRTDFVGGDPPPAPASVSATVQSASEVRVDWSDPTPDELGYEIERSTAGADWARLGSTGANRVEWIDGDALPATSYTYRVRTISTTGVSSFTMSETVTTPAGLVLLSATGSKRKGTKRVTLGWTGSSDSQVEVYRDGAHVATTANDGEHVDTIAEKGGGTYEYRICDSNGCSGSMSVGF